MNKIIRKKNENYTIVSNVCIRDNRLSLKAKGMMSLVMSLPNDWDFSIQGLSSIVKEGKSAIYAAINELKEFGYCNVITSRDDKGKIIGNELKDFGYCQVVSNRDDKGKIIGNDYTFFEEPCADIPYTEKPYTENQDMDNPNMDNQDLENQPQINKDIKEIKTEIIKEKENTNVFPKKKSSRFIKPTVEEVDTYVKEKGYHIDAENFVNYYESKGWVVGRAPMKDWEAACRNWEKTWKENHPHEIQNDLFNPPMPTGDDVVINGQIYR